MKLYNISEKQINENGLISVYVKIVKYMIFPIFVGILMFFIVNYLDSLPTNKLVENSSIKVSEVRNGIFIIFIKVVPFMVPLILATLTYHLNKYNEGFLAIILRNFYIKLMLLLLGFYFTYFCLHFLFVFNSNVDTPEIKYYTNNVIEIISISSILILILYNTNIVLQYFTPSKLISTNSNYLLKVEKDFNIFVNSFVSQKSNKKIIPRFFSKYFEKDLFTIMRRYKIAIRRYIDIFNQAIKNKDHVNIGEIWRYIDNSVLRNVETILSVEDIKLNGELSLSEVQKAELHNISIEYTATMTKMIQIFYHEVFTTAFDHKEYSVAEDIVKNITELHSKLDGKRDFLTDSLKDIYIFLLQKDGDPHSEKIVNQIIDFLDKLIYDLRFDYDTTSEYDENTINNVEEIIISFIDCNIKLNEKSYLSRLLECLDNISTLGTLNNTNAIERIIEFSRYCLNYKNMRVFEVIIKFMVINFTNYKLFCSVIEDKLITPTSFNIKESKLSEALGNSFSASVQIEVQYDNYLLLKLYIIYLSYFQLQMDISPDRMQDKERVLEIGDKVTEKINFTKLYTLLLDLNTHINNWDRMFVKLSGLYFVGISSKLLDKRTIDINAPQLVGDNFVTEFYRKGQLYRRHKI